MPPPVSDAANVAGGVTVGTAARHAVTRTRRGALPLIPHSEALDLAHRRAPPRTGPFLGRVLGHRSLRSTEFGGPLRAFSQPGAACLLPTLGRIDAPAVSRTESGTFSSPRLQGPDGDAVAACAAAVACLEHSGRTSGFGRRARSPLGRPAHV